MGIYSSSIKHTSLIGSIAKITGCLRWIQLQAHDIRVNELPMQVKFAGNVALVDETILLVKMDGGKIIHAHAQVDLANRASLPGPSDEIRQHVAPYTEIPVFAQDGRTKLARHVAGEDAYPC